MAIVTPRFTNSCWKWAASISLTHTAASSNSRERRYSLRSISMTLLSSATGLPSPGPHTCSSLAVQCSRDSKLTALSMTASPGRSLFCVDKNAGGRTSSTTARAKKEPTISLASGISILRSSSAVRSNSNPASTSASSRGVGCRHVKRRLTNSRSRGPSSKLRLIARLTTSGWYSLHFNSSILRMTSSVSAESKYSRRISATRILNSGKVSIGP
mmetsp:Transcript_26510/g.37367  ORF Transcript_26510/g.37367 Transcript_26510/m.37367 type:complete len:214 (-) Transcript_26510:636-1277(-)